MLATESLRRLAAECSPVSDEIWSHWSRGARRSGACFEQEIEALIGRLGAKVAHRDATGILYVWRERFVDDDPAWPHGPDSVYGWPKVEERIACAVRVKNATPEPDGRRREFVLRVHPELRPLPTSSNGWTLGSPQLPTARGAVASTFGLTADEYEPAIET